MKIRGYKTLAKFSRWLRSRYTRGGLILGYHRIVDAKEDPHKLAVAPRHFEEHLEVIQALALPVELSRFVVDLQDNHLPPRSIAITFDDGYADNLFIAKPLLERYNIPATVFISTGNPGQPFWWDEDTSSTDALKRSLTQEEIRLLADSRLFEIGSHTVTHPDLTRLSKVDQRLEIEGSKSTLEELICQPVTGFSYPHGFASQKLQSLVKDIGFHYACSGGNDVARNQVDLFHLPRFWIPDINGDRFAAWLRRWMI